MMIRVKTEGDNVLAAAGLRPAEKSCSPAVDGGDSLRRLYSPLGLEQQLVVLPPLWNNHTHTPVNLLGGFSLPASVKCSVPSWPYIPAKAEPGQ
ncbi:unnamed protein product [Pleuronectes platessa]|uniref:Uncharacterized protein n=1 Tax=Pleuronectes platessa TaxID=8262 RepID=A0A9N7ZA82_PLEPL|nr:unnamed protein product [Pleuronectes platessa]